VFQLPARSHGTPRENDQRTKFGGGKQIQTEPREGRKHQQRQDFTQESKKVTNGVEVVQTIDPRKGGVMVKCKGNQGRKADLGAPTCQRGVQIVKRGSPLPWKGEKVAGLTPANKKKTSSFSRTGWKG